MENQEKPAHWQAADSESGSERPGEGKLVRQLKNRHVAMIRFAKLSL
jgi:amino acid permease